MGFRINYIGAKCSPEQLSTLLGLQLGEVQADMPDGDHWVAVIKKSGWSIAWLEDQHFIRKNYQRLLSASEELELLLCEVNETTMWCSSELIRDQASQWKITHAGDGDDWFNLDVHGTPPAEFASLKEKHFEAQEDDQECDYIFEIPLDTASTILHFRHDRYLEPHQADGFRLLKMPKKRGLFSLFS